MRRSDPISVRTLRWMSAIGAATVLAGCAGTVTGSAATGPGLTLATASGGSSSPSTPTSTSRSTSATTSTSDSAVPSTPAGSGEVAESTGADPTDDDSYTELRIGDSVWTQYDDGGADVTVRSARFADDDGSHLLVTVDYECYDGEFRFDLIDWSLTDGAGDRHYPESSSGFGADGSDQFGTVSTGEQARGHLSFDVPAGAVTLEYDQLSGDPATWLVPAA